MEIQARTVEERAAASTRGALFGLALSMLLSSLGTSITNVALPTLATAFDASFQQVQGVVVAYLVGVTLSIVGAGRLGDVYGRRRVLVGGLLLFLGAAVSSGLAPSLGVLVVARLVQGMGAAVLMALTLAFVADIVPKARTGSAMGLLGTTSAIGTALGPSVGGFLTGALGWRAIFFVQVPVGLVALVLALRFLPEGRGERGLRTARQVASPLVPLAMLRDPALRAGLAMNMLVSTVLMATLVVGPFYLSTGLGLPAGTVGMVMAVGPLVAALTGVPAGKLVDHLGPHRTTTAGLVGVGVGAALLSILPGTLGIGGYLVPVAGITASYALFQAANNTGVLKDLGPSRRGVVSGMLTLSRSLGLVAGAALMGAVFAAAAGHDDIARAPAADVGGGMRVTFAVAAGLVMVALGVAHGGRLVAASIRTHSTRPTPS